MGGAKQSVKPFSFKRAAPRFAHFEKFSLICSSFYFVIRVNLLQP